MEHTTFQCLKSDQRSAKLWIDAHKLNSVLMIITWFNDLICVDGNQHDFGLISTKPNLNIQRVQSTKIMSVRPIINLPPLLIPKTAINNPRRPVFMKTYDTRSFSQYTTSQLRLFNHDTSIMQLLITTLTNQHTNNIHLTPVTTTTRPYTETLLLTIQLHLTWICIIHIHI